MFRVKELEALFKTLASIYSDKTEAGDTLKKAYRPASLRERILDICASVIDAEGPQRIADLAAAVDASSPGLFNSTDPKAALSVYLCRAKDRFVSTTETIPGLGRTKMWKTVKKEQP